MAWHRPQYDVTAFFPATPQAILANNIRKVMEEYWGQGECEGEGWGLTWHAAALFGPEFSQPECGAPDCYLDMGRGRGLLELGSSQNMHGQLGVGGKQLEL